jgi:hypothetical protein
MEPWLKLLPESLTPLRGHRRTEIGLICERIAPNVD